MGTHENWSRRELLLAARAAGVLWGSAGASGRARADAPADPASRAETPDGATIREKPRRIPVESRKQTR